MSQSRIGSAVESVINTMVGFSINFVANMTILPLFGFAVTAHQAVWMGVIFTIISVVRGYYIRRFFNWAHTWQK